MGGELAEERAAAGHATERADAEAAERLRVERDNRELLANNQRLQQVSTAATLEKLTPRQRYECDSKETTENYSPTTNDYSRLVQLHL